MLRDTLGSLGSRVITQKKQGWQGQQGAAEISGGLRGSESGCALGRHVLLLARRSCGETRPCRRRGFVGQHFGQAGDEVLGIERLGTTRSTHGGRGLVHEDVHVLPLLGDRIELHRQHRLVSQLLLHFSLVSKRVTCHATPQGRRVATPHQSLPGRTHMVALFRCDWKTRGSGNTPGVFIRQFAAKTRPGSPKKKWWAQIDREQELGGEGDSRRRVAFG